jgi:hypothetical protein
MEMKGFGAQLLIILLLVGFYGYIEVLIAHKFSGLLHSNIEAMLNYRPPTWDTREGRQIVRYQDGRQ